MSTNTSTVKSEQEHQQERDINEIFDEIVLIEERLARNSYDTGAAEGRAQGNEEGYRLGYAQGIKLGQELGGIYGEIVAELQQSHTERLRRKLQQLRECIDDFPRENDPQADIIGAIEHIRTLYKQCQSMLGSRRKQINTIANTNNTSAVEEKRDFSF